MFIPCWLLNVGQCLSVCANHILAASLAKEIDDHDNCSEVTALFGESHPLLVERGGSGSAVAVSPTVAISPIVHMESCSGRVDADVRVPTYAGGHNESHQTAGVQQHGRQILERASR